MSTPFRVFLLILASAGVLWAYRARSTDIRHWLRTAPPASAARKGGDLMSPLNRVVDPDATQARVWYQGKDPALREAPPGPEGPDPIYEPSPEDELLAADMPQVDGFAAEADGAPEDGSEAGNQSPGGGEAPEVTENEAPPVPTPPELEAYEEITHVLESGESLWSVAARYLGSGHRYKEIRELNRDVVPEEGDLVPAGTPLRIRIGSREKGLKPGDRPNDTSVEGKSAPRPRGEDGGGLLHTVRKDENLQRIARQYFPDDREGWRVLYDANQDTLPSPDRLKVGQVLRIPPARGR
jgi:nucleoid-associated protein YgaU